MELSPFGIGMTVFCPGFVPTRLPESSRNRQARYGPPPVPSPGSQAARVSAILADLNKAGLDPLDVAKQVVSAICRNELYVFTHAGPEWRSSGSCPFASGLSSLVLIYIKQGSAPPGAIVPEASAGSWRGHHG